MVALPWWYDDPDSWDTCTLGGNVLPGLAKVDANKGRKIDVKQPPGSHGATLTDQGYKPATVTITLRMWTPDHWTALQNMWDALEPAPTKKSATPFDITHPTTILRKITSVLIEDIDGPKDGSIKGVKEVTFKCVQYLPPPKKSATNTPKNSAGGPGNALTAPAPTPPSAGGVPPVVF